MKIWKKGKVIAFLGPNGVGKSTQMDLLISDFKTKNIKYRKSWVASHHLSVWLLGILLVKLGYPKNHWTTVNPDLPPAVEFTYLIGGKGLRVKIGKLILLWLELFNLIVVDLYKVRIPRLFGYSIIIEKYLPVSIADLTSIYGPKFLDTFSARFLLCLIPKDVYCIFLRADYESLLARRGKKTEPREYLDLQDRICGWYAQNHECLVINTSKKSILSTHELIKNYIKKSK